jgi:hypothetical protein
MVCKQLLIALKDPVQSGRLEINTIGSMASIFDCGPVSGEIGLSEWESRYRWSGNLSLGSKFLPVEP